MKEIDIKGMSLVDIKALLCDQLLLLENTSHNVNILKREVYGRAAEPAKSESEEVKPA